MQLSVLNELRPVVGFTSLVEGLLGGDSKSVGMGQFDVAAGLEKAREALAKVEQAQESCGSDAAWWGYEGQRSYMSAVVHVLEAAEITGADNLPDVPLPSRDGVVMDIAYHMEKWGEDVLALAQAGTSER